jgi:hypothetical protein
MTRYSQSERPLVKIDIVKIDLSKMAPWLSQPMSLLGPFLPLSLLKKPLFVIVMAQLWALSKHTSRLEAFDQTLLQDS